jgi:uncharacterized membrane protein YphA (DoxX/SURF4 family)
MTKHIISLVLLIVSVVLSFYHGWGTFNYKQNPASLKMMTELGITETSAPLLGSLAIVVGVLLLIPKTFFLSNLLNAISIVLIMALALRAGNLRIALVEVPFLLLPLLLIWLKYPFSN